MCFKAWVDIAEKPQREEQPLLVGGIHGRVKNRYCACSGNEMIA